jgi:hypothetical protein
MSVIGSEADLLSTTASVRSNPYGNATRRFHIGEPEMVTLSLYAGLLIWAFPTMSHGRMRRKRGSLPGRSLCAAVPFALL